jgi:hypothetical protein
VHKTMSSTATDTTNKGTKRKAENGNGSKASKQKNGTSSTAASRSSSNSTSSDTDADAFKPYSLAEIRTQILELTKRVPSIPEKGLDPDNREEVREFATSMQAIIEEFNLLLCCVSAATYRWGTDRTGAADQNLGLLSSELGNAQDQISSTITPRVTNVLAPVVDLVTKKSVTTKDKDGTETTVKTYGQEENDPSFIKLCSVILCRNAAMLRRVLLTNFTKTTNVMRDYLKATKKDGQNSRNAFAY